jgi:hypothetical protein
MKRTSLIYTLLRFSKGINPTRSLTNGLRSLRNETLGRDEPQLMLSCRFSSRGDREE